MCGRPGLCRPGRPCPQATARVRGKHVLPVVVQSPPHRERGPLRKRRRVALSVAAVAPSRGRPPGSGSDPRAHLGDPRKCSLSGFLPTALARKPFAVRSQGSDLMTGTFIAQRLPPVFGAQPRGDRPRAPPAFGLARPVLPVSPSPLGSHGCGAVPRPPDQTTVRSAVRLWVTLCCLSRWLHTRSCFEHS